MKIKYNHIYINPFNTTTNPLYKFQENSHYFPTNKKPTNPAFPNLNTTNKNIQTKYHKKINNKPNKLNQINKEYNFFNKLALLQCGDIEPNPGPMPDILNTHPTTHRRVAKTYFIPNTIKFHPEYQHLASSFVPILQQNHPLYHQTTLTFPYLHQYVQTQNHSPLPHILYAIIVTINPLINICNNILAQPNAYNNATIWTNALIHRLVNLINPPWKRA